MAFDVAVEAQALRGILYGASRGVQRIADRLESIPVAVLVADDGGRYIAANHRACELTGYTREELLTRGVIDVTHPHDLAEEERLWRAFERTHSQKGRYRILRKDGSTVEVVYEAYGDLGPGIHVSFLQIA